jgi:hypothetical protein
VAPIYLFFSLFQGHWKAVGILVLWWFLSRSIKIWPHLRQHWMNIRILPWYVFFNYWSAVMKIYAFFTMNQQGWITRWSRTGKASAWAKSMQSVPSYAATTVTVGLVALFIHSLHETPVLAASARPTTTVATVNKADYVGGDTVVFDPADWTNLLTLPDVTQCKSGPIATQMPSIQTAVTVITPVVMVQTTVAPLQIVTAETDSQLCVLSGAASGECSPYTLVPPPTVWAATVGGQSSFLPQWFAWENRWVAVTGTAEAAQLCFFSDPAVEQCTGYNIAVPPSWHEWWRTSTLPATLQQLQETVRTLGGQTQPDQPVQSTPQQLCVLEGANEGACRPYNVR